MFFFFFSVKTKTKCEKEKKWWLLVRMFCRASIEEYSPKRQRMAFVRGHNIMYLLRERCTGKLAADGFYLLSNYYGVWTHPFWKKKKNRCRSCTYAKIESTTYTMVACTGHRLFVKVNYVQRGNIICTRAQLSSYIRNRNRIHLHCRLFTRKYMHRYSYLESLRYTHRPQHNQQVL